MRTILLFLFAVGYGNSLFAESKHIERVGTSFREIDYATYETDTVNTPHKPLSEKEQVDIAKNGRDASFYVKVIGEDGNPIKDATVRVCIRASWVGEDVLFPVKTDEGGIAHVKGKSAGEIDFFVQKKGWYESIMYKVTHVSPLRYALKDGKWQPYGKTYEVVLRPKKNPIRMYQGPSGSYDNWEDKPNAVGYDFLRNDWVMPGRKGKTADVYFENYRERTADGKLMQCIKMTFPNKGDGICQRPFASWESSFHYHYHAPAEDSAYQKSYVFKKEIGRAETGRYYAANGTSPWRKDYFVIRIRTKYDDKGKKASCFYGTMRGESIMVHPECLSFSWRLNPTPNDTNIENGGECFGAMERDDPDAVPPAPEPPAPPPPPPIVVREETAGTVIECAEAFFAAMSQGRAADARARLAVLSRPDGTTYVDDSVLAAEMPLYRDRALEVQVEYRAFVADGEAAVVPYRLREKAKGVLYELKPVYLIRQNGIWNVLPVHGKHPGTASGGLSQDRQKERLWAAWNEFSTYCTNSQQGATPRMPVPSRATARADSPAIQRAAAFVEALKGGDETRIRAFFSTDQGWAKDAIDRWLAASKPFFTSAKTDAAVMAVAFEAGDAAIVPLRRWRKARPQDFDLGMVCLVRRGYNWYILPQVETYGVGGVYAGEQECFALAAEQFRVYKNAEREKARKGRASAGDAQGK